MTLVLEELVCSETVNNRHHAVGEPALSFVACFLCAKEEVAISMLANSPNVQEEGECVRASMALILYISNSEESLFNCDTNLDYHFRCDFFNTEETLKPGYCDGESCKLDGQPHPPMREGHVSL